MMPLLELLKWVLILGVLAWVIQALTPPTPYKQVAHGILLIILILVLFAAVPPLLRGL